MKTKANSTAEQTVDRVIDEGLRDVALQRIGEALSFRLDDEVRSALTQLHEALSDADWAKLNVIAGLFWSRIDAVVNALRQGNDQRSDTKELLRNLAAEMKSALARLPH